MGNNDFNTLPLPSTYEEAEAILQQFGPRTADEVWANLSEEQAKSLLKNLAAAPPPEEPRPFPEPAVASLRPEIPQEQQAQESPRPLPRLSEQTLLSVLETAPDALVVIDARGIIVLVNAQTERMFGYRRAELLGEKVEILVPLRNRGSHVQQRHKFLQKREIRAMGAGGMPLFGLHKDGREFPVEISLSPLETEDGLLIISVIRDVTEQNLHAAQLAKAEARYRSLVEEIPAVTFMASLDGGSNELYVSPQIVDLLGFTQQEWLDDPVLWHRQLHLEDRERWHHEFARTCATAQRFRSVYRFLARDGRVVWVLGEATVVRDHAGRPLFLQGVAFDITERKNAEEELKLLNQTLGQRVAERTLELDRSNKELERFGLFTSHELKKPLDAVSDILESPTMHLPAKELRQRLQRMTQLAKEMRKLISDMLDYARVNEGGKQFGPTDCKALFREARAALAKEIETSGAVVSAGRLPLVRGERKSLQLVLQNLLSNAIKYRSEKPPEIRVKARLQGCEWLFSVRDNGRGIPKCSKYDDESNPEHNYWENIFVLFHRHHSRDSQGEQIAGHGIGLSYCRRVIEYHGGKIWVESEEGKGNTFYFTLPAGLEDEVWRK